ncbi:hypothetical protein Bca4012_074106 [Brassica carinata]
MKQSLRYTSIPSDPLKTKVKLAKSSGHQKQQPPGLTLMNRGSTPKPKQEAEPHSQLSLTPPFTVATTACPNEETKGKTYFQTFRSDIETQGYKIYEEKPLEKL